MWQVLKAVTILFTINPVTQRKKFVLFFQEKKKIEFFVSPWHFQKDKKY